jgi:hypothetical protein
VKITTKKSFVRDGDVYVTVESERLEPEGSYLQVKFTQEGMVFDHLNKDGEVIGTDCNMYDDFVGRLM